MPMHEDECSPEMLVTLVDVTSVHMVFHWQGHLSSLASYMSTNQPLTISSMNSPTDDSPTNNSSSTNDSQETCIKSVVKAVCTHMLSFRDAAKQFNIPATTISNHLKGGKAPSIAHESQQLLSNKQQKIIIEWLKWHGNNGNPMTGEQLAALIFDLMEQRPSANWIHKFLRNHADKITERRACGLDPKRAQAFNEACCHMPLRAARVTHCWAEHTPRLQRTFTMRMRREFSWEGGGRTSPSNTSFQRKIVTSTSCDRIHSYW